LSDEANADEKLQLTGYVGVACSKEISLKVTPPPFFFQWSTLPYPKTNINAATAALLIWIFMNSKRKKCRRAWIAGRKRNIKGNSNAYIIDLFVPLLYERIISSNSF